MPAFPAIASLIPATGPGQHRRPQRDGVIGNTATVTAVTLPAGRPATVLPPTPRDASVAGNVITAGAATANLAVCVQDTATRTERAATLPINPVPAALTSFGGQAPGGPYGPSASHHLAGSGSDHPAEPDHRRGNDHGWGDDFNIMPGFNGIGPNLTPILALAVPANTWTDQVVTGSGNALIDVNRYVGTGGGSDVAGSLHHPARVLLARLGRAAAMERRVLNGIQRRSLIQRGPGVFRFTTEHIHSGVSSLSDLVLTDPYAGASDVGGPGGAVDLATGLPLTQTVLINQQLDLERLSTAIEPGDSAVPAVRCRRRGRSVPTRSPRSASRSRPPLRWNWRCRCGVTTPRKPP